MPQTISTGQPSTLGTYKQLASTFGDKAVEFIQAKIDKSPKGENEEVIASESQVMILFAQLME